MTTETMTTEKKFFVEMKNKSGEYEPIGVMSYDEAIQLEFTTHHAIRINYPRAKDP